MVFRYLRMLEGVSPPLQLTHLSCQATAKAFAATCKYPTDRLLVAPYTNATMIVFDRMFSLGMRGNRPESQPIGSRVSMATTVAAAAGPRRHFLYCSLGLETVRPKKTREL